MPALSHESASRLAARELSCGALAIVVIGSGFFFRPATLMGVLSSWVRWPLLPLQVASIVVLSSLVQRSVNRSSQPATLTDVISPVSPLEQWPP
jgi:hypothetical protein